MSGHHATLPCSFSDALLPVVLLLQHHSITNPQLHLSAHAAILLMQIVDEAYRAGEAVQLPKPFANDVHAISTELLGLMDEFGLEGRLTERPRLDVSDSG